MDDMTLEPNRIVTTLAVGGVALTACLAGCASSEPSTATATPRSSVAGAPTAAGSESAVPSPSLTGTSNEPRPAGGITITSGGSDYGRMLFDDDGQAIYIWERETSAKPRCYDECAEAWPPVLTDGVPVAAGKVAQGKLGTTKRSGGATQVTYNGHPLYYYADEDPGEVRCHNVSTHGGLWWVIKPNGARAP